MKMKKNIAIAYISLFAIFICAIHMIFFVCKGFVDTNNYENRPLYEMPDIKNTQVRNFAGEFDNYFNDHIPFRNQLIGFNNRINYYLFHSTTGDQVLIGKDGWLFIKDKMQGNAIANYTGEDLLNDEELERLVGNVLANKKYLEDMGIEFVVMIAPNKSRVYPEYMPNYLGQPAENYAVKQIVDYLKDNTDVRVVYDYDALIEAKNSLNAKGINLYHKADTHWNKVGAYVGASQLLKELDVNIPDVASGDIVIEEVENEEADLAGMLHMKNDFIDNESDYRINGYADSEAVLGQNDFNQVIEYTSNALDDRCVYIIRDSFATAMGEYVGSQFARVYMRHNATYTSNDLLEVMPDVVVIEVAERTAAYTLSNLSLLQ